MLARLDALPALCFSGWLQRPKAMLSNPTGMLHNPHACRRARSISVGDNQK
jgi:hypothetical protein